MAKMKGKSKKPARAPERAKDRDQKRAVKAPPEPIRGKPFSGQKKDGVKTYHD